VTAKYNNSKKIRPKEHLKNFSKGVTGRRLVKFMQLSTIQNLGFALL
jgi:hypothetical protein